MSCPFYARALLEISAGLSGPPRSWFELAALMPNTANNQCALITSAYAPCRMQIDGDVPDWHHCERNPQVNGSYQSPFAEFDSTKPKRSQSIP